MTARALTRTPIPASYPAEQARNWRETGTHAIVRADHVEVCACGPANHLTGPQFATVAGVEYRQAAIIPNADN